MISVYNTEIIILYFILYSICIDIQLYGQHRMTIYSLSALILWLASDLILLNILFNTFVTSVFLI